MALSEQFGNPHRPGQVLYMGRLSHQNNPLGTFAPENYAPLWTRDELEYLKTLKSPTGVDAATYARLHTGDAYDRYAAATDMYPRQTGQPPGDVSGPLQVNQGYTATQVRNMSPEQQDVAFGYKLPTSANPMPDQMSLSVPNFSTKEDAISAFGRGEISVGDNIRIGGRNINWI